MMFSKCAVRIDEGAANLVRYQVLVARRNIIELVALYQSDCCSAKFTRFNLHASNSNWQIFVSKTRRCRAGSRRPSFLWSCNLPTRPDCDQAILFMDVIVD